MVGGARIGGDAKDCDVVAAAVSLSSLSRRKLRRALRGIVGAIAKGPATQLLDPGLGGLRILEDVVAHAAGVVGMR